MAFSRVSTGDSVIPSSCEMKYEPASYKTETLCPCKQLPLSLTLQPLVTTVLLSDAMNLTTYRTQIKLNHTFIFL